MSLLYKECGRIIGLVIAGKGSVKSLCLSTRNKAKTKVYAIVFNVLQHYSVLRKIAVDAGLQDCPVLHVHLYELLYSKGGLKTGGALKTQLKSQLTQLKQLKAKYESEGVSHTRLPLYVRINTLKMGPTLPARYTNYTPDPHVPHLLKFPPNTNFSRDKLYREGCVVLQDKASCLSALVLSPPQYADVIDACSAPGNKTLHLSALMRNTGRIFAVERDRRRWSKLQDNIARHGASNITPLCTDFLSLDPALYPAVTHILVDPSCSGSGMVTEGLLAQFQPVSRDRVTSLARLQVALLAHALSFPGVRRVVYSTCSVYNEENEEVVKRVLETHSADWELERVLPSWERRGDSEVLETGDRCIRCTVQDQTNGFFLSCFVRKDKKMRTTDSTKITSNHKLQSLIKDRKLQTVFAVKHLAMRYRIKHHYRHPYRYIKV